MGFLETSEISHYDDSDYTSQRKWGKCTPSLSEIIRQSDNRHSYEWNMTRVNRITSLQGAYGALLPGGTTIPICVNMRVRKFSEKGAFFGVRLRSEQIWDMNFRDMGPLENLPDTHVNIGFYPSDSPGPYSLDSQNRSQLSNYHMGVLGPCYAFDN